MAFQVNSNPYRVPLQGDHYQLATNETLNGRNIVKYKLDSSEQNDLHGAVQSIKQMLLDNPELVPTFDANASSFLEIVRKNSYLTINDKAVCLSEERRSPPGVPVDYRDKFFSEGWIHDPTKCSKGHYFEIERAICWKLRKGDVCPAGEDHSIGELNLDEEHKRDISEYKIDKEERAQREDQILKRQEELEEKNKLSELRANTHQLKLNKQQSQIDHIAKQKGIDPYLMGGVASKVLVKATGQFVCIQVGKTFAKQLLEKGLIKVSAEEIARIGALSATKAAAKEGGKSVAKYGVPILSVFIGIGFASYRCYKGEYYRAGGEVISGVLSGLSFWFPPCIAAAITLDLTLAGIDVKEACSNKDQVVELRIDLNLSYKILDIDIEQNPSPTREEVDTAYRKQSLRIHSDTAVSDGAYIQSNLGEIQKAINEMRDLIYRERGWR